MTVLDTLPRYFAVIDQPAEGVTDIYARQPRMVACVTVDDVRLLLRRNPAGAAVSDLRAVRNELRSALALLPDDALPRPRLDNAIRLLDDLLESGSA